MKILQLISSLGFFGAENVVVNLTKELNKSGVATFLGVFQDPRNDIQALIEKIKERRIPYQVFPCRSQFDLRTLRLIRNYVRDNDIDIIHSHGYKTNFYTLFLNSNKRVKLIATVHNWIRNDFKLRFYELIDKFVLRKFNAVVVVSNDVKKRIEKAGVNQTNIFFVNNGIDVDKFSTKTCAVTALDKTAIINKEKIIGTVGRLSAEKGQDYLIEAFSKVLRVDQHVKLLIIGDGPLKEQLVFKVKNMNLGSKVVFLGKRDDIPELLEEMDIFVLPSLVEAMPMALLEAMAAKKAVIASAVGSIPELVHDGNTGILVEAGNVDSICKAILSILNDLPKREKMGCNAYNKVRSEFSSDKMTREYLKIYNNII